MELTGRPSFTVHDSCTHDRASRPLAGDVALTPCACAPETRSAASNTMSAAARATGARPYLRDGGGCPDVFSMEPLKRRVSACSAPPRKLVQPPRAANPLIEVLLPHCPDRFAAGSRSATHLHQDAAFPNSVAYPDHRRRQASEQDATPGRPIEVGRADREA